jgi:hypothetical protein
MRKSGVLTLLLAGVLALGATPARGPGGACPTAAQYINPTNPTGPLITLASKGVTNCYYVAANGSDSNDGLSEAAGHPWLHAPRMPAATGNPAALTASANIPAGTGIIIRGGDTWHLQSGSPRLGLPVGWPNSTSGNQFDWNFNNDFGTATNEIYVGVDYTWFTGSQWTRPIFNFDNPTFRPTSPTNACTGPNNSHGFGPTCNTTGVAACTFPWGNLDLIGMKGNQYVWVDDFEFTGMCWNDRSAANTNEHQVFATTGQFGTQNNGKWFTNHYFHGWTHEAFTPTQCGAGSTAAGVVCGGPSFLQGGTNISIGAIFAFNVMDGSDSDDLGSPSFIDGDAYDFEENIENDASGTNILDNCHLIHDNVFEGLNNENDGATHTDVFFCFGEYRASGVNNFYYNNLFKFIGTKYNIGLSTPGFWLNGNGTTSGALSTDYIFNNVWHDVYCPSNCFNFDSQFPNATYQVYNNTFESVGNFTILNSNAAAGGAFYTSQNNHFITNNGSNCAAVYAGPAANMNGGVTSCSGDLFQTHAVANGQGYTSANDFQPTAGTNATVGAGANESSLVSAFGPAFANSATAGCKESFTNTGRGSPTVVCPNFSTVLRPTSGACPGTGCWNAGAFNFVPSTVTLTPASYIFAATAVGSNSGDSPVTFTLTNNTGVTITGVAISSTGANAGDFSNTTSCVTTLASSASCQIFVTFRPTATGTRTATLTVSDSDATSPQTSSLSGTAIPSVINPSPANPVTFGVAVTDPSIPSTVKNERHSENVSAYNFDRVVLAGFLH